jgi:uncharacterized protein GlcG (DUF336 family)
MWLRPDFEPTGDWQQNVSAGDRTSELRPTLSALQARQIIDDALTQATTMGMFVSVAVVDESGVIKEFKRMDGAALVSVQSALSKAYAAAAIGMPPEEFFDSIESDRAAVIALVVHTRLALVAGGLPLVVNGDVAGAIGVAGAATGEEDRSIAEVAIGGPVVEP